MVERLFFQKLFGQTCTGGLGPGGAVACGTFADVTPGLTSTGDQSQSPRLRLPGEGGISRWGCATCAVPYHNMNDHGGAAL